MPWCPHGHYHPEVTIHLTGITLPEVSILRSMSHHIDMFGHRWSLTGDELTLRWWSTSLDKQNNEISSCFRCNCSACRGLTSWLHCCHAFCQNTDEDEAPARADGSLVWGWGPHSNVWDQGWLGVSWKLSMPCQMPSVSQRQNWRVPQLEQVYNHDGKTQFLIFFFLPNKLKNAPVFKRMENNTRVQGWGKAIPNSQVASSIV